MNVDGSDVDIQDVKAFNNGKEAGDGDFTMRWFNAGKYDYAIWSAPLYDPADPEEELDYNGWGDLDEMCPVEKKFAPGGWFLIAPNASVKNPTIQVAGAIVTSDNTKPAYEVACVSGTLQVGGNPFPVSCDIQSIVPMNNGNAAGDGDFTMRWFNAGKYDYAIWSVPLYDPADPEEELEYNGWGDLDEMCPITKTFAPGEGFLVAPNASVKNAKLLYPNPLYTK